MPRLRLVLDDGAVPPALHGPALRARRLHDLMDGRRLEDHGCYRPSGNPPRYVVIQEYADSGRDCGQWIVQGDDFAELLRSGADGWYPVEIHDLDAEGTGWGIEMTPRIVGNGKPAAAIDRAKKELNALAAACEYDPDGTGSGDALIDFKDAVYDLAFAVIAAGWSA